MTPLSRARRWGALAAEIVGSLLLVLAVFAIFLSFLYALFPEGTPLKELMESRQDGLAHLEKKPEATLSALQHDVRLRRGSSIAWGGASEGMQLFSQDAVQTFDDSGAKISFDSTDHLLMGSNSLVVVTRLDGNDEAGQRSYRVQVDGQLRGNLSGAERLNMELDSAGHRARMAPGASRFKVSPNGKNSASLSVYAGEAQLIGKGGMLRVPANFGVMLNKGVPVGPLVRLPEAPTLNGPEGPLYRYRLLPPKVRFSWSGREGDYHFQLSRDPRFGKCLLDQRVASPEYVTGSLEKGRYYWRVSRCQKGLEGRFSRVGSCELQQLLGAPGLKVSFPPERAVAGIYTLSGEVGPGSRVFVDGSEVACRDGRFSKEVNLRPGVNLIRVESLDVAGNASYASRIVYGSTGPAEKGATSPPQAGPSADLAPSTGVR